MYSNMSIPIQERVLLRMLSSSIDLYHDTSIEVSGFKNCENIRTSESTGFYFAAIGQHLIILEVRKHYDLLLLFNDIISGH